MDGVLRLQDYLLVWALPGFDAKSWMPLFQSLVWPMAIGLVVLWRRVDIARILGSIATRIEQGDQFSAGPIGLAQSKPKLDPEKQPASDLSKPVSSSVPLQTPLPSSTKPVPTPAMLLESDAPEVYLYLLHSARRDSSLDKNGRTYYKIFIWIDADELDLLDDVASVTYYLHHTFSHPVRTKTNKLEKFALTTQGWGQFNLYADIRFSDGRPPLRLQRYVNF